MENIIILYSRGSTTKRRIAVDTLLRGILKIDYSLNPLPQFNNMGFLGKKIYNIFSDPYASLGYANDWRDEFLRLKKFNIIECNINDLIHYKKISKLFSFSSLIIILHSATGDNVELLQKTSHWFEKRAGQLAVFLGNEYDLIAEKKDFIINSGANILCTQLPLAAATHIYGDIKSVEILEMPHALNNHIYKPNKSAMKSNKIGFIGARYPCWIGDTERNDFIDHCIKNIDMNESIIKIGSANIDRLSWANFLTNSQGTVGAEAGTNYLDKNGTFVRAMKKAYLISPDELIKTINDEKEKFNFVSGKAISSRHLEPIGTHTAQLLVEGHYNGILQADKHYYSVKKDFSNFDEKYREFNDTQSRLNIIESAYDHVISNHTYEKRVKTLLVKCGF
jgi:hypothetical protein